MQAIRAQGVYLLLLLPVFLLVILYAYLVFSAWSQRVATASGLGYDAPGFGPRSRSVATDRPFVPGGTPPCYFADC